MSIHPSTVEKCPDCSSMFLFKMAGQAQNVVKSIGRVKHRWVNWGELCIGTNVILTFKLCAN